jgi:transcriptional regulator with XRE-family HTH domain
MPAKRPSARHRKRPDPLAAEIGARIKRLRTEKPFTFNAFVEEIGLGRGYVSELERGLVVPTITALARVGDALEVTVADLVISDSPRERLFELTRELPDASVRELLARVQRATEPRS